MDPLSDRVELCSQRRQECAFVDFFGYGSRGRTRTYNHTINSRVLYH